MPSRKTLALTAGYAALAAVDTVLAGKSSKAARRARFVVKPLLMPALAAAFVEATPGRTDLMRRSTLAAQAFSWGGDVALLGKGDKAFLAGVGSFFAAHAAYITGFTSARAAHRNDVDPGGLKAAAVIWTVTAPVMSLAARRRNPELALPVAGYGTILATMFATSTTLDPAINPTARRNIKTGTALFLASDAMIGIQDFLLKEKNPALESAVMATYTAGQALIAGGVAHR